MITFPDGRVIEIGGHKAHTTNNQMELAAAIEALKVCVAFGQPITLYSDSTYVLRGMTDWISSWKRRGWKTAQGGDVLNRELWEELDRVAKSAKMPIEWRYVPGHQSVAGNERADEIAVSRSQSEPAKLYAGPIEGYPVKLFPLPSGERVCAKTSRGTPYYLSLLGGVLQRHKTWPECEKRVKGKRGAKYRKVVGQQEEREVLKGWGVSEE